MTRYSLKNTVVYRALMLLSQLTNPVCIYTAFGVRRIKQTLIVLILFVRLEVKLFITLTIVVSKCGARANLRLKPAKARH